ncbi:MAG: single-stranded DNA-binding protein [Thermomicrobiales bacterium]
MDQGYLGKGRQVVVTGRLEANEYTGNDGSLRTSLDVTANDVQLVGGRNDGSGSGFGGGQQGGFSGSRTQQSGGSADRFDDLPDSGDVDDIPF